MNEFHPRQQAAVRLADVDEIEVEIEKLVEGGDGFARYDGIPIFVALSAPGDLLRVRLTERRPGYGRAEILEILTPGDGRRTPPCPHFTKCGGCSLQHLDEATQLRYKAGAVRETLRRLGGIETPANVSVIPGRPWGYRQRTQLHLADTDRGREFGYYARGSRDLVPVERCPVLVPELEEALPEMVGPMREVTHQRIDLVSGDNASWTTSPPVEGLPQGDIETEINGLTYSYDARCFFQGHRQLTPALIEHTLGPETHDPDAGENIAFDLFAGVGLFSLPLAQRFHRVVAVESDRVASRFLRRNARRNKFSRLEAKLQSVESWITRLPFNPARVIVDPPRLGLPHGVRRALVAKRPRRLTYVSCNAATLARDLKQFGDTFRIESLALLDMFPQTGHMEIVIQLVDAEISSEP